MTRKYLGVAAALLFCCGAVRAAVPGAAGGKMEVYLEALDGQGWQLFFLADAVKRRLPAADLKVYPLVTRNADGTFTAKRGETELAESVRLAALDKFYPGKVLPYLSARSMSPSADGWRDAAVFAGINPDELERRAASDGQAALAEAYDKASRAGAPLLLDGKPYEGSKRLLPLYEAVNAALPAGSRVPPPAGYKPRPKAPPPAFFIALSSGMKKNDGLVNALDNYFEGIKPVVLAYGSDGLAAKFPWLDFLPAYIIAATPEAKSRLENEIKGGVFKEKEGYLVYEDRQGRGFYASRPEKQDTLEVFVMSECPYGTAAENSLLEAVKDKTLPPGLKLEFHFIGDAKKAENPAPGASAWAFSSLHGEPEWRENARQLFISRRFPDKFFAYLLERNRDVKSPDWEKAAKAAGLDAEALKAGAAEGEAMLAEDFAASTALGISSSPSFILNGREFIMGLGELAKAPGFEKLPPPGQPGAGCNK